MGESEANIRKLFEEAEEEQAKRGVNSGLHIIIFDELDAICKQRGSSGSSTGVHDTVVNQLLSKIDGVNSLNNVLIIGKFSVVLPLQNPRCVISYHDSYHMSYMTSFSRYDKSTRSD